MKRLSAYFLTLGLTATLLAAGFPGPGTIEVSWPLAAFFALAPAGWAAANAHCMRRLIWTSFVVGLAWWLVMLHWLIPVTGPGYALLAAFMACYFPAALAAFRLLHLRLRIPAVLALPLAWVTFELVRSHWPEGGFAWFLLGHTQAPYDPAHGASRVIQIADVLSEYGVSFLLAMTSGALVDVAALYRRRIGKGGAAFAAGLTLAALAASLGYGEYRLRQWEAEAHVQTTLRVAVVQTDVPQRHKERPQPGQMAADWRQLLALTRAAAAEGPLDLIVWPETVTPGPLNPQMAEHYARLAEQWADTTVEQIAAWSDAAAYEALAQDYNVPLAALPQVLAERCRLVADTGADIRALAAELNVAILVGATTELPERAGQPGRRFNSVYLFQPGQPMNPERYDKVHRVPFGEYIPWVEYSPWLKDLFLKYISPYDFDYTLAPGSAYTVFAVPLSSEIPNRRSVITVAAPICFEDVIARVCRRMIYHDAGGKRADLLANLTNDAWYHTVERVQHLQMAVFRSVENRVPTARSVNTGVSGFIDSSGRVTAVRTNPQGEGFVVQEVRLDARQSIFGRIGHTPWYIASALTGALTLVALLLPKRNMPAPSNWKPST